MVEIKANPGDYVKLGLAKREVEGYFLESHDRSVVLLKLKSGYNIGINKENILRFKIVRKFKQEDKDFRIPSGKGKPSIGLVVTGGTIASKLDSRTGAVSPITKINEFARFYPKLFDRVNVKKLDVPFMVDSGSMGPEHWIKIAESVEKMLSDNEIQGVIVTHGTDTLHYTASALSFFLQDLNKPVVLTYSQRSIDRASSDAELNLDCAASFALSDCAEVVITGHGSMDDEFCYAIQGTKARKMHASRRDAFKSINAKPVAKIFSDNVEFISQRRPRNKQKVKLDNVFNDKVALVKFYPGQKADILDFYLDKGYKGVVLEVFGLGQIATSEVKNNWIPKIKKLVKAGVFVGASTQTINGRLNPKVYSSGRELEKAGVVFLEDMLSETAFVKLGYVMGHRAWRNKIKEKMLENFSGEFREILNE